MAKWTDRHIYPWMEWMRFIYATWNNINTWTYTPTSPFKFAIFTLNMTVGSLLLGLLMGLMAIPQTIEWIMNNIGNEVEKLGKVRSEGIKHTIKEFTYVMLAIFVLIPYAITWGLPKLIMEHRENKRLERLQAFQTAVNEDRSRWDDINDRVIRVRRELVRDFTPKREIKAHTMVEPRTINTVNYSIAIGSNNTARGNHSISPWPSDVTIRIDRENNTSTAYIRTDNMT